jgi:hypothetical protein
MWPKPYQIRLTVLILALLCLVLTSACAMVDTRDKQLLLSGTALQAGADQAVAVGNMYNAAYTNKQITADQYRPWSVFANHFKAAYPLAVDSWKAVNASGDVAAQSKLEVVIRDMLTGLSKFSVWIIPFFAPPNVALPVAAAK